MGSTKVNAAFGAMVIAGVACVVNALVMLTMRARGHEITFRPEGLWLVAIAGAAAAGVDIFSLLAYERGLRLTSGLVIGGTSTGLVLLVGFLFLREAAYRDQILGPRSGRDRHSDPPGGPAKGRGDAPPARRGHAATWKKLEDLQPFSRRRRRIGKA